MYEYYILSVLFTFLIVVFFISKFAIMDCNFTLFIYDLLTPKKDAYYNDSVVWIIGNSGGISEQIACHLAKYKAHRLILSADHAKSLTFIKEKCLEINKSWNEFSILILPFDLTVTSTHATVVRTAMQWANNKIHVVIYNAGRCERAVWYDIEPETDIHCFKVNALGQTNIARHILRHLEKSASTETKNISLPIRFIVVSSLAGIMGISPPFTASYNAAKLALTVNANVKILKCKITIFKLPVCQRQGYFRSLQGEFSECGDIKVVICCLNLLHPLENSTKAFTDTKASNQTHGEEHMQKISWRLSAERCSELILLAGSKAVSECWIERQQAIFYLTACCPPLARWIIREQLKNR
ncbi:Dehydrogenase/reductase SDR family member 7 [Trichinella pseudospiralis]|uniref:Dehydrogenase/reductase SDR family member 7 n=1 Tax=Trichinella pseudospiralis TaxID=6337 RepID=A0A0V1E6Y0_TRIPS|nr:Dehydrogenase/reductase SDR family member 7 [Trichinella pseudospiralis]